MVHKNIFQITALATALALAGCGGGDGYYDSIDADENKTIEIEEQKQYSEKTAEFVKVLSREAKVLFGQSDIGDSNQKKGYFDHTLDTFGNGVLELAIDAKKALDIDKSKFSYEKSCPLGDRYTNSGCYILLGSDQDPKLKDVLNSVSNGKYNDWDFDVRKSEVANMKMTKEEIDQFTGKTIIIIFENENMDKDLNDVWVSGVFKYPYQQSWGIKQTTQTRIVSMQKNDGEYNIPANYPDQTVEIKGAVSIYMNPLHKDGKRYDIQNDSAFSVLTNDNPQTPDIEAASFTIKSVPGTNEVSTYIVNNNGTERLSLANVVVTGQRLDNLTPPSYNDTLQGSVSFNYDPKTPKSLANLFQFMNASLGATLNFEHKLVLGSIVDDSKESETTPASSPASESEEKPQLKPVMRIIKGSSIHEGNKKVQVSYSIQ